MTSIRNAIEQLELADHVGDGGRQRDVFQTVINEVFKLYLDSHVEADNKPAEALKNITNDLHKASIPKGWDVIEADDKPDQPIPLNDERTEAILDWVKSDEPESDPSLVEEYQTATISIPFRRVLDLLCSALEGGSNYWVLSVDPVLPEGIEFNDFREGGKFALEDYFPGHMIVPFYRGCKLKFEADDYDVTVDLDTESIAKGLALMSEKSQEHFNDFLNENDDSVTGDVFLQYCLFGEVVFG